MSTPAVEHAVAVGTVPPAALLAVGAVVHALFAAGAQALASSLLERLSRRRSRALLLVREGCVVSQAAPDAAFARMWIGRLAGRAPPAGAGSLAPSSFRPHRLPVRWAPVTIPRDCHDRLRTP